MASTLKLPPKSTNRYRVLKAIHQHGPQNILEVLSHLSSLGYEAVRAALSGERQMGLLDCENGVYSLTVTVMDHFDKHDGQPVNPPYVGQIVPPREAPAMTNGLSPKNQFWNAPRREPLRDISFVSCGSSFIPWPEGA